MKPILFNTEMVQAILDGRKTCTRRVIKRQPDPDGIYSMKGFFLEVESKLTDIDGKRLKLPVAVAPYRIDDVLYVREAWRCDADVYSYRAGHPLEKEKIWHPSIHMPKEAARIFLQVKGVRAERLQDMTCDDMLAEGVIPQNVKGGNWQQWQYDYMRPLWDSTIKSTNQKQYCWNVNPWVWVVDFKRIGK